MTGSAKRLALVGGGGFAKEMAEVAKLSGYAVESVYSSQPVAQVGRHRGYLDELLADRDEFDGVALAIGGVSRAVIAARAELIAWLERHALPCPALVSPHALIGEGAAIGAGAFIAHGVIVNIDVRLGRFCVLNTGAIIGHDAVIGRNTTVSPGAFIGGRCRIGAGSLIGPLAKIIQGTRVGDDAVVGMGCNVLRDVPDHGTIWPRPDISASDRSRE